MSYLQAQIAVPIKCSEYYKVETETEKKATRFLGGMASIRRWWIDSMNHDFMPFTHDFYSSPLAITDIAALS